MLITGLIVTGAALAIWLLLMHWVDLYWLVLPTYTHHHELHGAHFSWMDLTTMIGLGGIFFWAFWAKLVAKPVVPVGDPKLALTIEHVNH